MPPRAAVGWAILGCGRVADRRIGPVFHREGESRLIAVCSRNASAAKAFAERHGAQRAYDDIDALLADPTVNAVYVATPNVAHVEHVKRCLAAGKNVLVEKPMALNACDAAELVKIAKQSKLHLGVMHQQRFHPANIHLIRMNDEGRLGKLNVLRMHIGMWYPPAENWRSSKEFAGGGAAIDLGPHAIDLMLQIAGDAASIDAFVGHVQHKTKLEDFCSARIHFRNGAVGLLDTAYCMHDYGGRIEAYGSEATFVAQGTLQQAGAYQTWFRRGATVEPMVEHSFGDCFRAAIEDFADTVLHGNEPTVSGHDGARVMRIIDAIYESAARRCPVNI